jgi:ferrous iron transport protein B
VASLLVFFVFALQCMSTLAIMRRETNSWRWPAFAFSYLLALAYAASFATHRIVESLLH